MAGIITDGQKLGGVPQSASRHVALSTAFDVYLGIDKKIGFISSITVANTRTVTQIKHINSEDAGINVDTSTTSDAPTLSFNGFYVYKGTNSGTTLSNVESGSTGSGSLEGVGSTGGRLAGVDLLMTLDQQNIPFDIVIKHFANNAAGTVGTIIGVYKNCTISSISTPIAIGTAAVSDSGSISVGYVARSLT
jgi:hypothetical protein